MRRREIQRESFARQRNRKRHLRPWHDLHHDGVRGALNLLDNCALIRPHLLLAARMRGRHAHAATIPLHLDAAGTFDWRHLDFRQRAGHRRHKRPDQQQHQRTELAKAIHRNLRMLHGSHKQARRSSVVIGKIVAGLGECEYAVCRRRFNRWWLLLGKRG